MTPHDKYFLWFLQHGLAHRARLWLWSNPPPKEWTGSRWAWAFEEMPVPFVTVIDDLSTDHPVGILPKGVSR